MSTYLVTRSSADKHLVRFSRLPLSLYPDNSPVLNMQGGLDFTKDETVVGMLHEYTTYQEFTAAMMVASRLHEFFYMGDLYLPYLPGARQDKPRDIGNWENKPTGDILRTRDFTLDLIDMVGFDTVHILDAHSEIDYKVNDLEVKTYSPAEHVANFTAGDTYDGVIAADKGGVDRASEVAKRLGVPLFFGTKVRNPQTNALTDTAIKGLQAKANYLVVDDICDGGGTFLGLGDLILAADATADLYVTHGLFTKGASDRLRRVYGNLYASDSLGYVADSVTTISMVNDLMIRQDPRDHFHYFNIQEGER